MAASTMRRVTVSAAVLLLASIHASGTPALDVTAPVLVVVGPSGVGKTTVIDGVMAAVGADRFAYPVSTTTRDRRPTEVDGVDYNFVSVDTFKKMQDNSEFLVVSPHNGADYGLTIKALEQSAAEGKIVLVEHLSSAATVTVKETGILSNAQYVIIVPPGDNMKEMVGVLRARLMGRGTDATAAMQTRLDDATKELAYASLKNLWDLVLVNDDIKVAVSQFDTFIEENFPRQSLTELAETVQALSSYWWCAIVGASAMLLMLLAAFSRGDLHFVRSGTAAVKQSPILG